MQARMKKYQLTRNQTENLLKTEPVGRLATLGEDGFPYITPVHFVYMGGCIYFHGLAAGSKLANIQKDGRVCFEVERLESLLHDANPCDTNTVYQSAIIMGRAEVVEGLEEKKGVLDAIVAKYTPQHRGREYPENMVKMTAVVRIAVTSCTGKYYPGTA